MLKVGLTGGLACGKSFVGQGLAELGCRLIQADQLGREVMEPGGEAFDGVVREFGPSVLGADGHIERRALGALVFDNPERLAALNAIVHPPVLRLEEKLMAEFAALEPKGIAVVEAAILIETGSYKRFDKIILVMCDEEQQVRRAMKRDGLDEAEVRARMRRQMPLLEKRKYADFVIDASGEKQSSREQTRKVYEALRRIDS